MTTAHIDHILTFANVNDIDVYVDDYRSRGFLVSESTHRYKPGLRNRFVTLGCEYVEFAWVEDEAAFAADGGEEFARMFVNLPALRQAARPFGIGFKSADVDALHHTWSARGYHLPATWSFAPPGFPPVFSFQAISNDVLPGMQSFALTYHGQAEDAARQVPVAPNTVYALDGLTLVCATPEANAARWRDLLAPAAPIAEHAGIYSLTLGAHQVHWMTPELYQRYLDLPWVDPPPGVGAIGALHLLASNVPQAEVWLGERAKRIQTAFSEREMLVMGPDEHDGLAFTIRECPIETWRAERMARTGEKLVVT